MSSERVLTSFSDLDLDLLESVPERALPGSAHGVPPLAEAFAAQEGAAPDSVIDDAWRASASTATLDLSGVDVFRGAPVGQEWLLEGDAHLPLEHQGLRAGAERLWALQCGEKDLCAGFEAPSREPLAAPALEAANEVDDGHLGPPSLDESVPLEVSHFAVEASADAQALLEHVKAELLACDCELTEAEDWSLTAESMHNYVLSTFKVRFFSRADDATVVEFQRRAGDGMRFMHIFRSVLASAADFHPRCRAGQGRCLSAPLDGEEPEAEDWQPELPVCASEWLGGASPLASGPARADAPSRWLTTESAPLTLPCAAADARCALGPIQAMLASPFVDAQREGLRLVARLSETHANCASLAAADVMRHVCACIGAADACVARMAAAAAANMAEALFAGEGFSRVDCPMRQQLRDSCPRLAAALQASACVHHRRMCARAIHAATRDAAVRAHLRPAQLAAQPGALPAAAAPAPSPISARAGALPTFAGYSVAASLGQQFA